jgi:hypothetical protein
MSSRISGWPPPAGLSGHVRPSHGIRRFLRTRGATGAVRAAGRGGVRSTVSAIAVQAAPSMVSAVAAPLSQAMNAKMPASAWRGATNASTSTISVLACASGTHFNSSAVSRMVPTPKARKPSGRLLATGRSTILVIASAVSSSRTPSP